MFVLIFIKKYLFIFIFFFGTNLCSFAQKTAKQYKIHTLAFYNLENAFDTIDNSNTKDEYSPILKYKGNKSKAYWKKINNLARVLINIGKKETRSNPTIIGVCEVENSAILDDILGTPFFKNKGYTYIYHESSDWRGIDVALIYKEHVFDPLDYKAYVLKAWNDKGYRIKTRDQLLVSGFLGDEIIHIIVNHWPSQRGGSKKTAHLRIKSAQLTKKIIADVNEDHDDSKIIIMGDFNDNPDAKCFKETLNTSSKKSVLDLKRLYNPFENMYRRGLGSLGYRDTMNLFDQILFTSNLLSKDKEFSLYKFYKAGIYNPQYLITKKGKFKGYPFRSWSFGDRFINGFSDHYPVYIQLIKQIN